MEAGRHVDILRCLSENPPVEMAMRLSTITICLFVFCIGLPAVAQESISAGQVQPVADPSAGTYTYDPSNYNQWDPQNPETLYPAPGPAPTPPLGPCDQRTGRGYYCPKNWYVDQRVRIMYHPTSRAALFSQYYLYSVPNTSIDEDVPVLQNAGKSGSLGMEPSAGYDITVGKYLGRDLDNRDHFVEFNYYGLNKWDSRFPINATQQITITSGTTTTTFGNLFSLFGRTGFTADELLMSNVSGFNRADTQLLEYDSRWDNFELNLRIKPRMRADRLLMHKNACWTREAQEGWYCSYLMGARGVSLDEYFGFFSNGTIDVTQNGSSRKEEVGGEYTTRTRNDMFGLQIGLDAIHQKGPWHFGADVKGALFINFADQHSRGLSWGAYNEDTGTGDPYAEFDVNFENLVRSRDIASIAELGFMTSYQLRENMTVSMHYDLAWVTGLALAPEQFMPQVDAPARIDNHGQLLMQSLSLGLELVW